MDNFRKRIGRIFKEKVMKESLFEKFAKEIGAEYHETGLGGQSIVIYSLHDVRIVLRKEKPDAISSRTVISANLPNPGNLRFFLTDQRSQFYSTWVADRPKELQAEIPGLDPKIGVYCNDPNFIDNILRHVNIPELLKEENRFYMELGCTGTLRYEKIGVDRSFLELKRHARLFNHAIELLRDNETGDANSQEPPIIKIDSRVFSNKIRQISKKIGGASFMNRILAVSEEVFKPPYRDAWKKFAMETGAEYFERGEWKKPTIVLDYRDTRIVVRNIDNQTGTGTDFTEFSANLFIDENIQFYLASRQRRVVANSKTPNKVKGFVEYKTGNSVFDSEFKIMTNNQRAVGVIFSDIEGLGIFGNFLPELDITNTLRFRTFYEIRSANEWTDLTMLFRKMIDAIYSYEGKPKTENPSPDGLGDRFHKRRAAIKESGLSGNIRSVDSLTEALKDDHSEIRKEAAKALGLIGGERAIEALVAALSDDLIVRIEAAGALERIGDERAVDGLVEAESLTHTSGATAEFLKKDASLHLKTELSISKALKKIVGSNHELLDHYPRLFCSTCLRWAEKKKIQKGIFTDVELAVCPVCGISRDFLSGIEQVVGMIGGEDDLIRDGNTVNVRLWFDDEKRIRYGDIDRLVIRPGGVTHYEQAINALILGFTSDSSRSAFSTNKIPVYTDGNLILSGSVMRMIKEHFDFQGAE